MSKTIAKQFELPLPAEDLALVGQLTNAPACQDCGRQTFLVAGICEPCAHQREEAHKVAEARQRSFFP